ncbi:MAG TPA: AAA family ATPase [Planctomycetes bacterium]|nr:AAA family ATPase [Planctomycetota bacterium]
MGKIISRRVRISLPSRKSAFLWGPRRTGKSYWIRRTFPGKVVIDLLKTDVFGDYASRPALLRERYGDHKDLIVIDEIQMVPDLLNEVHWLIENRGMSFLLTGSSARKLRRSHANLLAGRARRFTMAPLTFFETEGFDLERVFVSGLLPPHFLSEDPVADLRSYVGDYLKEEIAAEAAEQRIPAFAEFLRVAAVTSGELLNYTNVARETGVSAKVVRGYFQILEDTLLGQRVAPWRKAKGRRLIETEKFYLFDIGVANYLARSAPRLGSPEFGKAFEHYILMELRAYQAYAQPELDIRFWRTSSGQEVDFVLGDMEVAVETKGAQRLHAGDLKGLAALKEEHRVRRAVLVSLEKEKRAIAPGIDALPWRQFLEALWAGDLGV